MKDGAIELESLETRKKGMELFIPRLPASAVSSSLHTVHPRIDQIDSPRTLDTVARPAIGKPTLTRLNIGDRTQRRPTSSRARRAIFF